MRIDPLEQLITAAAAFLTGCAAGVMYDLFRVLRRRFGNAVFTAFADILFCLISAAALFLLAFISGGKQRIYILVSAGVGLSLYFRFPSRGVTRVFAAVFGALSHIMRLLLRPFALLHTKLRKCVHFAKKPFETAKKQYIIIMRKFVYSVSRRKIAASTKAEGRTHEEKKGRSYY